MARSKKAEEVVESGVVGEASEEVVETSDVVEEEVADGSYKAVYRELLPDGTRKGAIAYKTFTSKKAADKFIEKTGGKLV